MVRDDLILGMGNLAGITYAELGVDIVSGTIFSGDVQLDGNDFVFDSAYEVIDYTSSLGGMQAILFRINGSDEYVVAFRGSSGAGDYVADLTSGIFNYNHQVDNAIYFVEQMMMSHGISRERIVVTGHSLGGILTQVVGSELQISGYAYNPYGSNLLATGTMGLVPIYGILGQLMNILGLSAANNSWVDENLLTVSYQDEGLVDGDALSNAITSASELLGNSHIGSVLPIFGENVDLLAGHNVNTLIGAITRYNQILAKFVPSVTYLDLSLAFAMGGDSGYSDAEDTFSELNILQAQDNALSISFLDQMDSSIIHDGIEYRFALLRLNPFVVGGDASLYDHLNTNGELDYDTYSEQFWQDRATLLTAIIQRNIDDAIHPDAINGGAIRFGHAEDREVFAGGNTGDQGNNNGFLLLVI